MLAIGLLLACINIVNLQIARSDESRREFSIRLAMGAGRFRVARQCLIEMLLLSIVSGCAGLVLFQPIATAVISIMTVWGNMPAHIPVRVDGNLFAFVLISSSAVAVFCGMLPAIYATRQSVHAGLQGGSVSIAGHRGPRSLIRTVGVVQLAISLLMTTATCLFALNLGQLRRFDGGIKRNRLVEAELDPSAAGYSEAQAVRLDERLRTRIASIPGVEEVSYSEDGIYSGRNFSGTFEVDKSVPSVPESERYGIYDYVGPKFFTTLGTTLLAGRDFSERDTASAPPVVIINQALATRFFPDRNPIGRPFYVSDGKRERPYQIIGTVRDVKSDVRTVKLAWYFAAAQHQIHPFSTCFLIRTGQNRAEIVRAMRARIRNEDHKLEIANVQTANDLFDLTVQTDRLLAALGWVFGILAILLASAGIYGLLSYDVARRRGEIGIRTALGARRSDIAGLMLSQAGFIVVFGLALGGIAANLLTRLFGTLVFEMKASDPRIELVAGLVLIAVAMAAAWLPVRRAACVDPMRALRTE
jgi:predicted permease